MDVEPSASSPETRLHAVVDYKTLVTHREFVDASDTVEAVYAYFQRHGHEYVAVTNHDRFVGLVSRGHVGFLLGARYGFAIYGRQPIGKHLLPSHLSVGPKTPLMVFLDKALSREGELFYDDVALVGLEGEYLGVIPVRTVVQLQTRLIVEKTQETEAQQTALTEKHLALSRSLSELRQSQGRFDILFQNSVLGVALLNIQGDVESRNRRFETLLGLPPIHEELRQLNLADLVVPSERDAFLHLLAHQEESFGVAVANGGEFCLRLPEHGPRHFKFFVNWIAETRQICALLDDVTEQRLLERKLAQKEKSALLESLVGGIAHELNNKLTPILMLADLVTQELRENGDPEELAVHCRAMHDSAVESARIIRQLLQLSKPAKAELANCDLGMVVEDALTILRHRLRQDSVEQDVLLDPRGIPVFADAQQIKQVVINLVLNGLDAMEKSPRRQLRIEVRRDNSDALISVRDTGCGIPSQHLNRIFDPFFTTKGPDRGSGLGLSVCYTIIKQHGGEILVHSTEGEGTVFSIRLPQAAGMVMNPLPQVAAETSSTSARAQGTCISGRQHRVLIVDDEEFITRLIEESLRRTLGCRVERASDGGAAMQRLDVESFDLVISDVRMPGIGGFELFKWIREHHPALTRRFFFITGDAGSVDLNEEIELMGVPVLRKPFPMEVLVEQCGLLLKN